MNDEIIIIENLEQYLSEIFKIYSNIKRKIPYEEILYRGHADKSYKLLPSIARGRKFPVDYTILDQERNLIELAKMQLPSVFHRDLLPVDLLALLQHYGIPTRLLDVTSNPLVALYFACAKNEKDGEVIVFQIQKSDIATYPIIQGIAESYKFSMGTVTYLDAFFQDIIEQPYFREQISTVKEFENGGEWVAECCQNLIIVRASEVATRQKMQQGRFILFPNKIKKDSSGKFYFEKIIEPIEKSDDEVKKVFCIPKEIKKELLTKLEILGISEATLFSDSIDMVCKGIVEECQRRL